MLLFTFTFLLAFFSMHGNRTWLHIKTGEKIFAEGTLPSVDGFSHSLAGRPWSTDSWLADVLFYRLHAGFGPAGLTAVKAFAVAAAFTLLLPLSHGRPLVAATVLGLAAMACWPHLAETPAVFDLLFISLLIRLLRGGRKFSWSLAAAPGVVLAWANFNGPTAILGVWLISLKVIKSSLKTDHKDLARYLALLALAVGAWSFNPHGWELLQGFLDSAGALNLGGAGGTSWKGPYFLFAFSGAAACWLCLQQEFFLSMSAATFIALGLLFPGLRAASLLAACPVMVLALGHFLAPRADTPSRVAWWAAAMGALLSAYGYVVYFPLGAGRGYGSGCLEGATHFLEANDIRGKLFNDSQAGDMLIGCGDRPVFIDGREGFYGPAFVKDASEWPHRWKVLDGVHRFDYAVLTNRRSAYPARSLDDDADWRLVYADDAALIYVKLSGANGWKFQNSPRRLLRPNQLWPSGMDGVLADVRRAPKVLEELDRWILQAPDSAQALLWKAYALERLKLAEKAERLIVLAERGRRVERDPELRAALAFVLEARGSGARAEDVYRASLRGARAGGDRRLEAECLERLAGLRRSAADEAGARELDARAAELRGELSREE